MKRFFVFYPIISIIFIYSILQVDFDQQKWIYDWGIKAPALAKKNFPSMQIDNKNESYVVEFDFQVAENEYDFPKYESIDTLLFHKDYRLPDYLSDYNTEFFLMENQAYYEQQLLRKSMVNEALRQLGKPYLWGGATPSGFDCSGFTKYVYAHHNLALPKYSHDQSFEGEIVNLYNIQPGDILFFGQQTAKGYQTSHTALVIANKAGRIEFVHAVRRGVSIENTQSALWENYWKRRFLFARRILPEASFM